MSEQQQTKSSSANQQQQQSGGKPKRTNKTGTSGSGVQPDNVLQHLKTVERVFRWPLVDNTWKQGIVVYDKIKGKLTLLSSLSNSS